MPWPEPVERVAAFLRASGAEARLEEFAPSATAQAAADAVGCALAQIVKSLVFVCDGRPVLALVPGDRRADPGRSPLASARARRASRARRRSSRRRASRPGRWRRSRSRRRAVLVERTLLSTRSSGPGAGSERHMRAVAARARAPDARSRSEDIVQESA